MPKSRRRKISNYQRIQARNRRAKAEASMEARARQKEEAKAKAAVEAEPVEAPPEPETMPERPINKSRERLRRLRQRFGAAELQPV